MKCDVSKTHFVCFLNFVHVSETALYSYSILSACTTFIHPMTDTCDGMCSQALYLYVYSTAWYYLVFLREGVPDEATGSEVGGDLGDRERCRGVRVQWREQ